MKLFSQKIKFNKAFTLLEVLVAISIFTVSILAIMSVLSSGISSTNNTKNKIIASYLAEEGIEYVVNLRNTAMLSGVDVQTGWTDFTGTLTTACGTACYYDDNLGAFTACSSDTTCLPLLYDSTTGKYGYATGTSSGFVRKILVTSISANEKKISSTVSWMHGSVRRSVVFTTNIYNWIE